MTDELLFDFDAVCQGFDCDNCEEVFEEEIFGSPLSRQNDDKDNSVEKNIIANIPKPKISMLEKWTVMKQEADQKKAIAKYQLNLLLEEKSEKRQEEEKFQELKLIERG